jgi:transcriptional regulator with XRE-family HTH domain
MNFQDWLREQITQRDLTYTKLGERAGISHARISQVLAGENPSADLCISIARGLGVDPVYVLRIAEKLPPGVGDTTDPTLAELWALAQRLSEADRVVAVRVLRGLVG